MKEKIGYFQIKKVIVLSVIAAAVFTVSCERVSRGPVRIGISPWPGYDIVQLAFEKGFFKEEGLNVRILRRGGTLETKDDFIEGKVDVAALTLFEALDLINRGEDLIIFLVLDHSKGSDGIVIKKELVKLSGLKGRRAGVQTGAVSHYVLLKALEKSGLSEEDVTIADTNADEAVEAFAEGRVDALATWEPYLDKAAKEGGGRVVFSSSEIPGFIADVFVARRKTARARPAEIRKIIRAWFRTVEFFKDDYLDAVQTMAEIRRVSPEEVKENFKGVQIGDISLNMEAFGDGKNFGTIFTSIVEAAGFMRSKKMIKEIPDLEKYVDSSYFFKSQ